MKHFCSTNKNTGPDSTGQNRISCTTVNNDIYEQSDIAKKNSDWVKILSGQTVSTDPTFCPAH